MLARLQCVVGLIFATTLAAADATGVWNASFTTPNGQTRENTLTLKADGEKLTGKLASARGESDIRDGVVKGEDISFSVVRNFGGNDMEFKYKGKIAGDEIKFTVDAGGRNFEMTAKRSK